MAAQLGEVDYRHAGLERLRESAVLLQQQFFAGGVYMAGRAVENMLRALIWKNDLEVRTGKKSLGTGHDLTQMLTLFCDLGVLRDDKYREELRDKIQYIARIWFNNLRFWSTEKLKRDRRLGQLDGRHTIKMASQMFYDACSLVVKRCEALCQQN
jgi:hypothetical protein